MVPGMASVRQRPGEGESLPEGCLRRVRHRVERILQPERDMDNADSGAATVAGYSAAEAAQTIQDFLEGALSLEALVDWLDGYPYGANGPQPDEVEDEINQATLAVRGLQRGSRDAEALRRELMEIRSRLSGFAFSSGQSPRSGSTLDPTGRPIDRSFP